MSVESPKEREERQARANERLDSSRSFLEYASSRAEEREKNAKMGRVQAYLSAIAPIGAARVRVRAADILQSLSEEATPEEAVAEAQARVIDFWARAFGTEDTGDLAARRAIARKPDAFLDLDAENLASLRKLYESFNQEADLIPQPMAPSRLRALLGIIPSWILGVAAGLLLYSITDGPLIHRIAWSILLGVLLSLHSNSAVLALLGVFGELGNKRARRDEKEEPASAEDAPATLPETAIVIPIYHEDPMRVFSSIGAMRDALERTPHAGAFTFFVLSDSQNPMIAADEERAWRRLAAVPSSKIPVYYRRRPSNTGKKAGNIAEFAVRNEQRFRYMIVLDADSLISERTILELVKRIDAEPRLALLQAPNDLRGGETIYARALQFGHALAGGVLLRGLSRWSGGNGNYFGHNAIIRLSAFVRSCGLPKLAGAPPLGGPILSHDFVEAALLCRSGHEVRFAHDLSESYEEPPPSLEDYLTRDRRWCQGNLQHLRLVTAEGLTTLSRIHLLYGALAYLASPLWFAFIILGALSPALGVRIVDQELALGLMLAAFGLLLFPRFLAIIHALLMRRREFGGVLRLLSSVLVEFALSILLAPIMMFAQSQFVFEILSGKTVSWGTQSRDGSGSSNLFDPRLIIIFLSGIVTGTALMLSSELLALLLSPIWIPWILAPLLSRFLTHPGLSAAFRRVGLLRTGTETAPPPIIQSADRLRDYFHPDETSRFRDLILDPSLNARLRQDLERAGSEANDPARLAQLEARVLERGPAALSAAERAILLGDPGALSRLHTEAWKRWPVETWELPRPMHAETRER